MVKFYKDEQCIEPLDKLTFEENYIQDIYGGVLENVVEVGKKISKTIYMKNDSGLQAVVRNAVTKSPLMGVIVGTARLNPNSVTPVTVVFEPTMDAIQRLVDITDPEERELQKKNLLSSDIEVEVYYVL